MVDSKYYTTILSQTFSPCGNYLITGNNYGVLTVYKWVCDFNNWYK